MLNCYIVIMNNLTCVIKTALAVYNIMTVVGWKNAVELSVTLRTEKEGEWESATQLADREWFTCSLFLPSLLILCPSIHHSGPQAVNLNCCLCRLILQCWVHYLTLYITHPSSLALSLSLFYLFYLLFTLSPISHSLSHSVFVRNWWYQTALEMRRINVMTAV